MDVVPVSWPYEATRSPFNCFGSDTRVTSLRAHRICHAQCESFDSCSRIRRSTFSSDSSSRLFLCAFLSDKTILIDAGSALDGLAGLFFLGDTRCPLASHIFLGTAGSLLRRIRYRRAVSGLD